MQFYFTVFKSDLGTIKLACNTGLTVLMRGTFPHATKRIKSNTSLCNLKYLNPTCCAATLLKLLSTVFSLLYYDSGNSEVL